MEGWGAGRRDDWSGGTYLFGETGEGSSVVFEVTPHEVTGSQGGHEAQLPRQHSAGHYPG